MPAALSGSEHIRRQLEQNFDLPAAEVQDRLGKRGIEIEIGLVYQVRSKMKQERQAAEQLRQREAEKRKQEAEAQKNKLLAAAAKAQETRARNPKPLREHILDLLTSLDQGTTLQQIIQHVSQTYNWDEKEAFEQSVRKKLRLLVLSGDVTQQGKDFLLKGLHPTTAPAATVPATPTPVAEPQVPEGGIAVLVALLKQVVAKVGKQDAKELIDVL